MIITAMLRYTTCEYIITVNNFNDDYALGNGLTIIIKVYNQDTVCIYVNTTITLDL